MDDLKFLRNMRTSAPPPSPRAFGAAEQLLAKAASNRQRSPFRLMTGDRLPQLGPRRVAIADGLSLAVAAGAVGAYEAQTSPAAPAKSRVTAAAWTVARQPGGLVRITVRDLRNAAGLQRRLRSLGVPMAIEFERRPFPVTTSPRDIPRSCSLPRLSDKASAELQSRILPRYPVPGKNGLSRSIPGPVMVVRPAAIPRGIGLFFKAWVPTGDRWELDLVRTSLRCTG